MRCLDIGVLAPGRILRKRSDIGGQRPRALVASLAIGAALSFPASQAPAGTSQFIDQAMQLMADPKVWGEIFGSDSLSSPGYQLNVAYYTMLRLQEQLEEAETNLASAQSAFEDRSSDSSPDGIRRADFARDAILRSRGRVGSLTFKIQDLQEKIAELQKQMGTSQPGAPTSGGANQQVKAGWPADAGFLYGLSTVRWWSGAGVSQFDIGTGLENVEGTVWQGAVGGDLFVRPGLALGLGIGGRHGDLDAAQNSDLTVNGVNIFVRAAQALGDAAWIDASAFYGYDWFKHRYGGGAVDSYGTDRWGVGGGLNVWHAFANGWRAEGRLGWDGKWAHRPASVDTTGLALSPADTAVGRASAYGKAIRQVGFGEIFGDAMLRVVTNDNTIYDLDADPVDGVLGAGLDVRLGEGMKLTGRGHAVVGRENFQDYGGSLRFAISY